MPDALSTRIIRAGGGAGKLWLMVLGEELATHPLPAQGEVVLGRAPGCDVTIAEKSISRRHALLRIGDEITIEDLGSANGTRVGGRSVEPSAPVEVGQGEIIELGGASVIIQQRSAPVTSRRLWPHGYFEGRLEDECTRAARDGRAFSVVFLHCDGEPPAESIQAALVEALRQVDVAGEYGAGEYEMLLIDLPAAQAEERAAALLARLEERGVAAKAGVASFPGDGRTPDELLARASAAARGAAGGAAGGIVVEDPAMVQLRRVLDRVAAGTLSVLLLGETGVGKEVLAAYVHEHSPRSDEPFLQLSCSALSEGLLESELFGHEKGAFTGAAAAKPGLLETAHGGTIFLDEIGEIPLSTQVKLLRVLEERKVMRVGGLKATSIDVRFVAATNRDLEQEILRGSFREDLYYRLAGITLVVPPLRERVVEIGPLARSFIGGVCAQSGRRPPDLGAEALELLESYAWPGNIRELRNVMERAVLLCTGGVIRPEHLPLEKMRATYTAYRGAQAPATLPRRPDPEETPRPLTDAAPAPGPEREDTGPVELPDAETLEALYPGDAERDRIITALELCKGNQTKAAKVLGMSRRTLINRIERYRLPRPRKGRK